VEGYRERGGAGSDEVEDICQEMEWAGKKRI